MAKLSVQETDILPEKCRIVTRKLDSVKPHPDNPRIHTEKQVEKLMQSIRQRGDAKISISFGKRTNHILTGHANVEAKKRLGLTSSKMIECDFTEGEEMAWMLDDNHLGDMSVFDMPKLNADIALLKDMDYKMEDLSWEMGEIEGLSRERPTMRHNIEMKPMEAALGVVEEIRTRYKDKKTIFVSFSGGRDSTLATLLAQYYFPDKEIKLFFVDTGVEFPGMAMHIFVVCEFLELQWELLKPDEDFWLICLERGWPGALTTWCRERLIQTAIKRAVNKYTPEEVLVVDGSRADQAMDTSKKNKFSALPSISKYDAFHPVFDIEGEAGKQYLYETGVPLWEGYAKGFVRTACWCCPFQCSRQAFMLTKHYPGLAAYIRQMEARLKQKFVWGNNKAFDDLVAYGEKIASG